MKEPELDDHGHLRDPSAWSPALARRMADADGIALTSEHWAVIDALRQHYDAFEIEPPMRGLIRDLRERLNDPSLDSRALYRLFPEGPIRQGSRYAGLPLPVSCI